MHMADALISPAVGGVMLVATAGTMAYSIKKIKYEGDDKKIPLMGVMGAFVFAAQMINFSIPGTGSSGHLGGGLLLAILLGPYRAFITMASILLIQCLFFADGGILAYGCNVFNMAFYGCFIAYLLIYKNIIKETISTKKIFIASIVASIIGLQMGAFSVVIETLLSGRTELPFGTFVVLMQPIHLAIGIVEGIVTGAIIAFIWKENPAILDMASKEKSIDKGDMKGILIKLMIAVIIVGGALSWFASSNPDGLEWSMIKTAGTAELETEEKVHENFGNIQKKTAILPDYNFKSSEEAEENNQEDTWPAVNIGTSISGLIGGAMTLILAMIMGIIIKKTKKNNKNIEG